MKASGILVLSLFAASPATGQAFDVLEIWRSFWSEAQIEHPQSCEGQSFHEHIQGYYLGTFEESSDTRYRCVELVADTDASHVSNVTGTSVSGVLRATCEVSTDSPVANGSVQAFADANIILRLELPARRQFRVRAIAHVEFDAEFGEGGLDRGDTGFVLERPDGQSVFEIVATHFDPGTSEVDTTVDLAAGTYRLYAGIYMTNVRQNSATEIGREFVDARVEFEFEAIPCGADINWDNAVNLSDLGIILANLGTLGDFSEGDINSDYHVDLVDLATLLAGYGVVCD